MRIGIASRGASRSRRSGDERGSAVADFVLVAVVVVPLFFGILQLALIWYVKTTLTAAASEGARYGAAYGRTADDAENRTAAVVTRTFGNRIPDRISARLGVSAGQPVVVVRVSADVPVLAFWGPRVTVSVAGHALRERLP